MGTCRTASLSPRRDGRRGKYMNACASVHPLGACSCVSDAHVRDDNGATSAAPAMRDGTREVSDATDSRAKYVSSRARATHAHVLFLRFFPTGGL